MRKDFLNPTECCAFCSENYVKKANRLKGGVGFEKKIITAEIMVDLNNDWVIPVIRNNPGNEKVPNFLKGTLYIDFEDDRLYETRYEELLRSLLDEPVLPVLPIGDNPFETVKRFAKQKFIPSSEKYVSPAPRGRVTFDYSNNNGRYSIGSGELMFETNWSKASNQSIYIYNDPSSIHTVALVKDKREIREIDDARIIRWFFQSALPEDWADRGAKEQERIFCSNKNH